MAKTESFAASMPEAERPTGAVGPADLLAAGRLNAFVNANLVLGATALVALPLHLAVAGPPGPGGILAFAGLIAAGPIGLWTARRRDVGLGHLLLAVATSLAVAGVASATGGLNSPALFWFLLVPLEAMLSGSRRVVGLAALAAALALALLAAIALAIPAEGATGAAGSGLSGACAALALVYAAVLALRAEKLGQLAAEARRAGEGRYRLLAESITDLVIAHGPSGDVVFASPAARRLLGLDSSQILGSGLFRLVHVADRPAYLRALSETIESGVETQSEFRVQTGDGPAPDCRWLEMRCRPVENLVVSGTKAAAVAVARDITDRRARDEELRSARETAERANAAKTRFLANVSHELRTPLNAIIGFSELLASETFGAFRDERQREYVKLISTSGEHLLHVVNEILDMSKIESGAFELVREPFDVGALVEAVRSMMAHQAAAGGIGLSAEIAPDLPELVADRRACRQILLNLVSNAIKFTRSGGAVGMAATREGNDLVLAVADTGIGIAEKDLPFLGTPFVQADSGYDRRRQGTGLGLSVVRGLVSLHGGRFEIESRLGTGTRVTVRLPLGCARTEAENVVALPAAAGGRGAENVERKAAAR